MRRVAGSGAVSSRQACASPSLPPSWPGRIHQRQPEGTRRPSGRLELQELQTHGMRGLSPAHWGHDGPTGT